MVVSPSNSHPPLISARSLQLNYTENTQLSVLEGVALSDMDQTCHLPVIIGARVEITTEAGDNAQEILEVGTVPTP